MSLRKLLLRTYPRSWRAEYGPELAGILARTRLTPALLADVLAGGVRQHLRRDAPWKLCALGLALWTSGLLLAALQGLLSRSVFLCGYAAGQLFLLAAGAWTVRRENSGIRRATAASAKAALIPAVACLLVTSVVMLRTWGTETEVLGHGAWYWIWKNAGVTGLASLLSGLAGASFARVAGRSAAGPSGSRR
jgi:hypothetical protein